MNAFVAALHLLALGIGLGAVWARGSALWGGAPDDAAVARALAADNWWGLAALLWLGTGVPRLLWLEKGVPYYMHNHFFFAKMGLFAVLGCLELWPMVVLIGWRVKQARGVPVDYAAAGRIAWISRIEAVGIVAMVCCAAAMARGLGQAY